VRNRDVTGLELQPDKRADGRGRPSAWTAGSPGGRKARACGPEAGLECGRGELAGHS